MKDARREYELALADFSQPGNRWSEKGRLTYWGKAAGLTAEEIVADARAAGVTDRDADIRRGWNDARPQGDRFNRASCEQRGTRFTRHRGRNAGESFPHCVRRLIGDLDAAMKATADDVSGLSPFAIPADGEAQTVSFLAHLFRPEDLLYIFRADKPATGTPGANLVPCREWLADLGRGASMPGDIVVPNPFTGEEGDTAGGGRSFVAQSCLARFPFAVIEFDGLPLPLQYAFWRGLLMKSPLAPRVASITYSGGKSLHGLLHVACGSLDEWLTVRDKLRGLFAADEDPAFRADQEAMRPRTGTRLAGVARFENDRLQRLLYLNPGATGSK